MNVALGIWSWMNQMNKIPSWILRRLESPEESPTWITIDCGYLRLWLSGLWNSANKEETKNFQSLKEASLFSPYGFKKDNGEFRQSQEWQLQSNLRSFPSSCVLGPCNICPVRFRNCCRLVIFNSVQLLSRVWLFVTPWTAACQAFLSITNSQSLLKLMSVELVMPSNHLMTDDSECLLSSFLNETVHCDILSLLNHCLLNVWEAYKF